MTQRVPETVDDLFEVWEAEAQAQAPDHDVCWSLLPHQLEAWNATEREVGVVTGGGGGKTWLGARKTVAWALEFPDAPHLATANSYIQLQDVVLPELLTAIEELGIAPQHAQQKKRIRFEANGKTSEIRYRSLEKYNLLRGQEVGCVWSDEIRDTRPEAMAVVRTRMRHRGVPKWARQRFSTTTPNGYDHIHSLFVEHAKPGIHRMIRASARANIHLPEDYIEDLEAILSPEMARQEVDGEFVNIRSGQVYVYFSRQAHITEDAAYDPMFPIWVACDFNVNPMAWVLVHRKSDGAGNVQWHVFDEITIENGRIRDSVQELVRRYGDHPSGFGVTGDPANPRNHVTGTSDWDEMRVAFKDSGLKATFAQLDAAPLIKDRVAATNAALLAGNGVRRLFIHPRCKELKADLEQIAWAKGRADIDKSDPWRSHWSDALGYLLVKHGALKRRVRQAAA